MMQRLRALALAGLLLALPLSSAPLHAQDAPAASTNAPPLLPYGETRTGQIDNSAPRSEIRFDGLRGDLIRLALDVTAGDLAPVVLLLDADGQVIAQREAAGGLRIENVRLPSSGVYTVVIMRFGAGLGSTAGAFALRLDRVGASAVTGSALRYGDAVIGEVRPDEPTLYYTFRAQRGDVLTIQMRRLSGDLDPMLQVTDRRGRIIAQNDEILGSGTLDAAIDSLVIENTGAYVIIASRFGGPAGQSRGDFLLSLDTASNSALGTSALLAAPISAGTPVEGALGDDRYALFYRFEGRRDDVISVRMTRTSPGNLDTLVALTDSSLRELAANDDSDGSQNSAIENFVLPADGVYYLIATRYERADGQTSGGFQLTLSNAGSIFASVDPAAQRISYGSTVTGYIDDESPQTLYAFQGQAGDIITAAMSRSDGTLDPFISLLDASQQVLANDDDSAGGQNARIDRFTLPASGVYYLRATRFSSPDGGIASSGSFLLVLAQRFD